MRKRDDRAWLMVDGWIDPRLIFWNSAGLGWSIGKSQYLKTGSYWHKSGSDAAEPWMEKWSSSDVNVECVGGDLEKDSDTSDNGIN